MSSTKYTVDPGWDEPLLSNHDLLIPDRNKILNDKIISQKLTCSSGGNIYVFNPVFNSWFVLMDIQTVLFLNAVMDLQMASVNYDKAFRGYIRYIESRTMDRTTKDIPPSICVGTQRLAVTLEGDRLDFKLCDRLVQGMPTGWKYDIVSSFSCMSLDMPRFPSEWRPTYHHRLYRYIAQLFADNPIGLETVKWIIGRTLLDPTSFNKVLCLWGEGMKGKSKLIQALMVSLKGCIASIPEEALVSMSTGIPHEIKEMVVSNRLVTAGDVDTHFKKTNLAFMKSLTGQDYVSMPPTSVRSRCSLVYSTNTLDSPKNNPEWSTIQIARRFNIVHMNTNVPGGISEEVPQDYMSRADMVGHCLYTVMTNPDMPMSIQDLVLTLLQSELFEAIEYISYINPSLALDNYETITANSILAACMGVKTEMVGRLASMRTRRHIKVIDGVEYIVGIVPSKSFK
jgi:hypothetical protein